MSNQKGFGQCSRNHAFRFFFILFYLLFRRKSDVVLNLYYLPGIFFTNESEYKLKQRAIYIGFSCSNRCTLCKCVEVDKVCFLQAYYKCECIN